MSYCRWSSDDYRCDVYVYESADGFMTHVASNRVLPCRPLPPAELNPSVMDWIARHEMVTEIISSSIHADITLDHAGETFTDATPGDCADRLEELRSIGYHVPQYAIDELREDQRLIDSTAADAVKP